MKSRTVLRLTLLLAILFFNDFWAQDAPPLSRPLNSFSLKLYKKIIEKETSNLVFSPVSLSSAFAQMYLGSRQNTQREISQLFGFNEGRNNFEKEFSAFSRNVFTPPDSSTLELINANSIWVTEKFPISEEYIGKIKKGFNTDLFKMDFRDAGSVVSKVNGWASKNTKGKIKEIVSKDVIKDNTVMLLLNAVYFKDKWRSEFNKSATQDDDFFITASDKIRTPMMNKIDLLFYSNSGTFETVALPYKTRNYAMVILLPKNVEGLAALEDSLDGIDAAELMANLKSFRIALSMPSFKFEYPVNNLKESFINLGMVDAFDPEKADFSDMLVNANDTILYIQNVMQKAFIEVNEEGTEAAAVTAITSGFVTTSMPERPYSIKVDHPFLFFIVEWKTKSILFMGRCVNPKG